MVRARAALAPQAPAVVGAGRTLGYGDLLTAAQAVAGGLHERGVRPEELVAVCADRTPDLVVALLGIHLAGAAYVPFEITAPPARVQRILQDGSVRVVLTEPSARAGSAALAALAASAGPAVIDIADLCAAQAPAPDHTAGPDDLAYVLHTSGSTGEPKGVAMTHRPLRNLIDHQLESSGRHHAGRPMRTLQFTPLTFDVSYLDIFATLAAGGTVVLPHEDQRRDPARLLDLIRREEITSLFLPLVALQQIAETAVADGRATPSLREVMTGGEQLVITPSVARWFAGMPDCTLQNIYGPTEAHVVTAFDLSGDPAGWPTLPPIGAPIAGARLRLLDEQRRPVAAGDPGEIWISGVCLARGYLGRPDLTDERFVVFEDDGVRHYRTGDVAGELPDGSLQYLGRVDRQIKVQGVRMEPAEIESVLAGHPEVSACAVVARDAPTGGKRLVAYVVPRPPGSGAAAVPGAAGRDPAGLRAAWRAFVAERLPEAMVPTVWSVLESLPLTASGKVDRQALPAVSRQRPPLMTPWAPARTPTELRVAAVWHDVLDLDSAGADDNYFELGGTSLSAAAVARRLREEFAGPLPLVALFDNPTIRTLAAYLDGESRLPDQARTGPVRRRPRAEPGSDDYAIAIVGMACRFPGADSPEAFWRNLCSCTESITVFPHPEGAGEDFVPAAAVLRGIEEFDAGLFGISPQEARLLDPQHRLFLECAWEALQDSAHDSRRWPGTVGVFGGCGPSTYLINNVHPAIGWRADRNFLDSAPDVRLLLANDKDFLTSLVSYKLDLRGPSLNMNGACATSLLVAHYARRALIEGDCDLALAGAACVPVPQLTGHHREPSMPFSPDGHCRAFDEQADGTVFGSGVGVVVLKRLADALADGDDVYAVIRGSAVNSDGAVKVGMAAPSVEGQARVIAEALADAGVAPGTVRFVEAHGTATPVGDPIEVAALRRAFGPVEPGRCALGSVKTNVGHLGWAAGMAGLFKAVLALRHRQIPPTLHFTRPNPELGLERSPFYVNTALIEFPRDDAPRRAGVSAFGLGGVNAHLVLEEAPEPAARPAPPAVADAGSGPEAGAGPGPGETWHVVPLSGRAEPAVTVLAERFRRHLLDHPDTEPADLAATAGRGRAHFEFRRAVVGADRDTLVHGLEQAAAGRRATRPPVPSPRVAALFTGHGGEYYGMGRELYRQEPAFRRALDEFDEPMRQHFGKTAAELLYDPAAEPGSGFTDLAVGHACAFAAQVSLAGFWETLGVRFTAVLGHSLGEYAAACVAGVFSPRDGLALMVERGRLMAALPADGRMARVTAEADKVRAVLAELGTPVELAVVNSPTNTVISGPEQELRGVCAELTARGFDTEVLRLIMAGHSAMMDPVLDDFAAAAARIRLHPPTVELISSRTGRPVTQEVCDPRYWSEQVRRTVRFSTAVATLGATGVDVFVEIGGAANLLGIAQEVLPDHPGPWLPTLRRDRPDSRTVAEAIARLYESGVDLDWDAFGGGRRIHLPGYPFQRRRHWIDAVAAPGGPRPAALAAAADEDPPDQDWTRFHHRVEWQPVELPRNADRSRTAGSWLVFADSCGVGAALADELRRRGGSAVVVTAGRAYRRPEEHTCEIDPENPAHYHDLLRDTGGQIAGILHLWTLDAPAPAAPADVDMVGAIRPSLHSALLLLQAAAAGAGNPVPVYLFSRGAVRAAAADGPSAVAQAPLWGLGRVVAVERPDLLCHRVDLPADAAPDPAAVAGLLDTRPADRELALRAGGWYAPRLIRHGAGAPPPRLRADVTYLLAGGLGGLGLQAAEKLVDLGARRLVLAGRSAPTEPAAARIALLRAAGVEVEALAMDIADRRQVERLLDERAGSGHPVAGVIHFAGVLDDGMLTEMTWPRFEAVLRPKVQGAWNLHSACAARETDLDFFVLYSSATSVLGNFAQANYASANAFLDALAHHRQANGSAGTSINWGAWSGVGGLMSRPEVLAQVLRRGMGHITPRAGAAALAHSLVGAPAQVAVLPNDWSVFVPAHNLTGAPFFGRLTGTAPDTDPSAELRRRLARTGSGERTDALAEQISRILGQVTGEPAARIDADSPFRDLGMDSLSAIQVRNELQRALTCTLPPNLMFEHRTARALAGHLDAEVLDEDWRAAVLAAEAGAAGQPDAGPDAGEPGAELSSGRPQSAHRPLSVQQRRWLSLTREVGYGQRVVPAVFHTRLDRSAFAAALRTVVGRHELLCYRYPGGVVEILPVDQVVPTDEELFYDLTGAAPADLPTAVAAHVDHCRRHMPDPWERPSWTVRCLNLGEDRFMLLLGGQHLEFDGSGLSGFVSELHEVYRALVDGTAPQLPAATQYREFVEHQTKYVNEQMDEDRAYFSGLFTAVSKTTALPGQPGFARTVAAPSRRFTPERPLAAWPQVAAAADHARVSPFALLLASYARVLAGLAGEPDIVISVIRSSRAQARFATTVGPFTAPFPLPIRLGGDDAALIGQCHRLIDAVVTRPDYPSNDLIATVPAFAGFAQDTYFSDTSVNFLNYRRREKTGPEQVEVLEVLGRVDNADLAAAEFGQLRRIPGLHLVADVVDEQLVPNYWFHADRFAEPDVARLAAGHRQAMQDVLRAAARAGRD